MKADYTDIKLRIVFDPEWYDCNGTPRYGPFAPEMSPNIYANEVVLMEIGCQNCNERFLVEVNQRRSESKSISAMLDSGKWPIFCNPLEYGDPPRHDCVGDTMSSVYIKIVEFWAKRPFKELKRIPKYEITLDQKGQEL